MTNSYHSSNQQVSTWFFLAVMGLTVLTALGFLYLGRQLAPGSNLPSAELKILSRAYERTSLIVTTNLPFEAWTAVMGNERLTGALLDRLTHRIHVLEANGESYRLRESKDRQKQGSSGKRTLRVQTQALPQKLA